MNKRFSLTLLLLTIVSAVGIFLWWRQVPSAKENVTINGETVPPLPILDKEEITQGQVIYSQYCASCHGADLEGVSNWKISQSDGTLLSPPHDSSGHTWHHPDSLLIQIISDGGLPENGYMPAFRDILGEDEMYLVLTFIKSSWGIEERKYQWWISSTQNSFYE